MKPEIMYRGKWYSMGVAEIYEIYDSVPWYKRLFGRPKFPKSRIKGYINEITKGYGAAPRYNPFTKKITYRSNIQTIWIDTITGVGVKRLNIDLIKSEYDGERYTEIRFF